MSDQRKITLRQGHAAAKTIVLRDPRIAPSTGSGSATANGATITVAATLIAGVATGRAATGGQTVSGAITIISGVATGRASAAGQVLSVTVSLIPGVATGAVAVPAQDDVTSAIFRRRRIKNLPSPGPANDDDEVMIRVIEEFMRLAA